jgi:hypothetical protein
MRTWDTADPSIEMEALALTFEVHDQEWGGESPIASSPFRRGSSDTIVQRRRVLAAPIEATVVAPKLHNAILSLHRDDPLRRAYIRRRWTESMRRNIGCS